MNYVTIIQAQLYNNNGIKAEVWPAGKPFSTGQYIKNARLYLGPTLLNRWISVGDYRAVDVVIPPPPVDPPPPVLGDRFINIREFAADRITVLESTWWRKVVE